jgi:hypothetical protein
LEKNGVLTNYEFSERSCGADDTFDIRLSKRGDPKAFPRRFSRSHSGNVEYCTPAMIWIKVPRAWLFFTPRAEEVFNVTIRHHHLNA